MSRAMSTIESHSFDSAQAKAYLSEFLEDPSLDFLEDTFEYDADDLGEATDALMAAELVAALIGAPSPALPADVKAQLKGAPSKKLLNKARNAVRSILDPKSPLHAHWQEAGIEPWLGSVKALLNRIT